MKPILYAENTTSFTTKGLGTLSDAISCVVTEERNGAYELEMEYPIDGIHVEDIKYSRIIYAIPSDGARKQPFRIYAISKPIDGIITVNAEHISYQLAYIPCGPFTATNVGQAFVRLKDNALEDCPFTFWTDKSTIANYNQTTPASMRSRLGGSEGSILDVYGGEYEWDGYTVKLHNNRGANNGVTLRYGKNITDIEQEESIADTITGVVPFFNGNDGTVVTLPEHAVYSQYAHNYPYNRTIVMDFSSYFQDAAPTVTQLRSKANAYINSSGIGIPKVNLKISFIPLWQTEEYKDIASLERVKLCDTVNVYFEKLGIEVHSKVVKTEYNVLLERYNSIELGEARSKMSTTVSELQTIADNQVTTTDMERAIESATNLITGGLGGYVVMKKNANGKPEEILIMDTDDVQTAVNVIRMNKNGIGFSTTGYNGPFTTAWTIDGSFVADFITAGTLRAIDVEGVHIKASTYEEANADGSNKVTIDNGVVRLDTTGETMTTLYCTNSYHGYRSSISPFTARFYHNNGLTTVTTLYGGRQPRLEMSNHENYLNAAVEYGVAAAAFKNGSTTTSVYGSTSLTMRDANGQNYQYIGGNLASFINLSVSGTKSRISETDTYGDRLFYCYETPTPYFGDLGEGKTDESGKCYIFLDDILDESTEGKYQVFLQAYGDGRLYVSERTSSYFVVEGEPNTAFGWELKAPQRGYSLHRLEPFEHEEQTEDNTLEETYQYLNQYLYNVEGESA